MFASKPISSILGMHEYSYWCWFWCQWRAFGMYLQLPKCFVTCYFHIETAIHIFLFSNREIIKTSLWPTVLWEWGWLFDWMEIWVGRWWAASQLPDFPCSSLQQCRVETSLSNLLAVGDIGKKISHWPVVPMDVFSRRVWQKSLFWFVLLYIGGYVKYFLILKHNPYV